MTSDVLLHSIKHHAYHDRHRRSNPAGSQGHPRTGGPINRRHRLRIARRSACRSSSLARPSILSLDLAAHEGSSRSFGHRSCIRGSRLGHAVSYSLDVNVLLYASDRSSDRHQRARSFLESCAAGPEILCLAWPTLMSYLRIATTYRCEEIWCPTFTSRPFFFSTAFARYTQMTGISANSNPSICAIRSPESLIAPSISPCTSIPFDGSRNIR